MHATTVWVTEAEYKLALERIKETLGYAWYPQNASWPNTDRKRREQLIGLVLTTKEAAQQVADCLRQGGFAIEFGERDGRCASK